MFNSHQEKLFACSSRKNHPNVKLYFLPTKIHIVRNVGFWCFDVRWLCATADIAGCQTRCQGLEAVKPRRARNAFAESSPCRSLIPEICNRASRGKSVIRTEHFFIGSKQVAASKHHVLAFVCALYEFHNNKRGLACAGKCSTCECAGRRPAAVFQQPVFTRRLESRTNLALIRGCMLLWLVNFLSVPQHQIFRAWYFVFMASEQWFQQNLSKLYRRMRS